MADQLSNRDLDLMVRTVAGEDSSPDGQTAVANVILNRLASGAFGKTASDIVLAPNQFEPWATRGRELASMSPNSPRYQQAMQAVTSALQGDAPDPTGGATHFFAPKAQAALGRQLPKWAVQNQPTAQVGGHLFYAPQGIVSRSTAAPQANTPTQESEPMAQAKPAYDLGAALGFDTQASDEKSAFDLASHLGLDQPSKPPPSSAPKTPETGSQGAVALGAGLVNGLPIAGPYLLSGLEKVGAAGNAVLNNSRYSDELDAIKQRVADANVQHPGMAVAGHLGGATAGYVAAGLPAAGAKVLGIVGPSMASRMAYGTASNALIGGADAAARGEDVGTAAAFGAGGGFLAPGIGGIAGGVANKLTGAAQGLLPTGIEGVSRPAANILTRAIAADDPAAVRAALAQAGEFGMLADAGPSLTGVARAIRDEPGQGSALVHRAISERASGANERIAGQLDTSLGPARDPAAAARDIGAFRSDVNNGYQAVHATAPPVDAQNVASFIDRSLETATGNTKKALLNLRAELIAKPASVDAAGNTIPEVLVADSQKLHNIRKDIDLALTGSAPALGVQPGAIATKDNYVTGVREALDDALKAQVPGMAELDAKSAMLADRQNAVERGFSKVLRADGPHPQTFAADRAARPAGENIAENIGLRGRIDRMFGTGTQRDAVTLNKLLSGGEDGYAVANLKTAFGDEPVNKLVDTLNRERTFANTNQEVLGNSATSRSKAAGEWLKEGTPGSTNLSSANLTGVALQTVKRWVADPMVSMILRTSSEPMRAEMARVLTMQGQTRDQVVSKLLALHARQGQVSAVGGAISNAANIGANRLMMGASGTMRPNSQ